MSAGWHSFNLYHYYDTLNGGRYCDDATNSMAISIMWSFDIDNSNPYGLRVFKYFSKYYKGHYSE